MKLSKFRQDFEQECIVNKILILKT